MEARPRARVSQRQTARVTGRRASRGPVLPTPWSGIVAGVRERDRVRPSDRVEQRCELARVRHRDGRDPVERAFRHACMRAPIRTREPAMIARASSRSRGATTSRSAPNSAVRASTAGASLSRSWESSTCGSTRDRSGSREQHADDRRHGLAVRARVDVRVLLPQQTRDVEDDVARPATPLGGGIAKARSLVTASTGRPSAAAACGTDRIAREDERRPMQRATTEHATGDRREGTDRLRRHHDRSTDCTANSWTADMTEWRCEP